MRFLKSVSLTDLQRVLSMTEMVEAVVVVSGIRESAKDSWSEAEASCGHLKPTESRAGA